MTAFGSPGFPYGISKTQCWVEAVEPAGPEAQVKGRIVIV
jgi:hypothetical protein